MQLVAVLGILRAFDLITKEQASAIMEMSHMPVPADVETCARELRGKLGHVSTVSSPDGRTCSVGKVD